MDRILGDNGQQASYVSINHKANPSPYALQFKNFEDRLKHGKTKSKQTTLNMRKQKESPEEDYLKIAWGVIKDKMQVQFFEYKENCTEYGEHEQLAVIKHKINSLRTASERKPTQRIVYSAENQSNTTFKPNHRNIYLDRITFLMYKKGRKGVQGMLTNL